MFIQQLSNHKNPWRITLLTDYMQIFTQFSNTMFPGNISTLKRVTGLNVYIRAGFTDKTIQLIFTGAVFSPFTVELLY